MGQKCNQGFSFEQCIYGLVENSCILDGMEINEADEDSLYIYLEHPIDYIFTGSLDCYKKFHKLFDKFRTFKDEFSKGYKYNS